MSVKGWEVGVHVCLLQISLKSETRDVAGGECGGGTGGVESANFRVLYPSPRGHSCYSYIL